MLAALIFVTGLSVRLYKLDSQTLECEKFYTLPAATGHQYVYLSREAKAAPITMPSSTDEYRRVLVSESGLGLRPVTAVLKRNVHLPAYFYFMHYWIASFGNTEFALRLPSAFFGALAVMMLCFLGRELSGISVGVLSALLLAFSPEQIYFSQQARMYPLLVLLAISSSYLLLIAARRADTAWIYLLYACLSIIGFMFSAGLLTARGQLRGKPDRHREMALYVDSQTSGPQKPLAIAEGLNSIPLAMAYYGKNNMDVLRFKWITDQLEQRSFLDVLGQRREVLLLVSGQSQAAKLLSENGFRMEAKSYLVM